MHRVGRLLFAVAASLILAASCGCTREGEFPQYPITLICPWAAGGGTDRVSRQLALFLEEDLGVPVNVVNATGGAGVTGHSRGLRARPDGYTLMMMTVEINMLHWRGLTTVTWGESRPVMSVNTDAAALFVQGEAPWNDLAELRAALADGEKLKASGTAAGGIWHLALAGWVNHEGLPDDAVEWVPMNGAGPSLLDLIAGGLDLVCCSLPEAKSLLESGEVRCLGVMAEERVRGFEEVPTFAEQGSDWTTIGWRGLAVPKGTPDAEYDRLLLAMERINDGEVSVNGRTFPEYMADQGFDHAAWPPDEFAEKLKQFDEQLGVVLKDPKFENLSKAPISRMFFPNVLLVAGAVILIALAATRRRTDDDAKEPQPERKADWLNAGVVVGAVLFYALAAETIGFVLAAVVVFLAPAIRFGAKARWAVPWAILLSAGLYQVFAHVLRAPLPRGWLGW